MKKFILIISLFFIAINISYAQATDFTTNDCNGNTHNLFDSLDAGNIIVIAWVMPCGPCATYAGYAYSAVQSFSVSHPGKVDFYLVDDYANTACSNLVNWGNTFNMPINTTFSSADISMSDYGTDGMPKVVVLSGANHQVYYNMNDSQIDFNAVESAISNALTSPLDLVELENKHIGLTSFPNPNYNGLLNIYYNTYRVESITFDIINTLGTTVLTFSDYSTEVVERNNKELDISILPNGVYFLKLSTSSYSEILRFVVAK